MRILADVAIAVAKAIVTRELLASGQAGDAVAGPGGRHGRKARDTGSSAAAAAAAAAAQVEALSRKDHPGKTVVPMRLFGFTDMSTAKGVCGQQGRWGCICWGCNEDSVLQGPS